MAEHGAGEGGNARRFRRRHTYVDPAADLWKYHLVHWTQNGHTVQRCEYRTPGAALRALAVVSSTNVWMVGQHWNDAGGRPLEPIVLHCDGRRVTRMNKTLDAHRDATLAGIDALPQSTSGRWQSPPRPLYAVSAARTILGDDNRRALE